MGLSEDGERWARAAHEEEKRAAERLARAQRPLRPPWFGELLDAVRGKVEPVAFYEPPVSREDRTLVRKKVRFTVDYRYIEHRWVVSGAPGGESEWGGLYLDSFSFSEQGFLYDAGSSRTPQVSEGRYSAVIVNTGLLPGPVRIGYQAPLLADADSWHRRLAAFAVHRLETGGCQFPEPGVIYVGIYGSNPS